MAVGRNFALPPSHLLRQTFETAPDFAAAKQMLCATPIAVPAIFVLCGMHSSEGCVIERTESAFAVREMADRACLRHQPFRIEAERGRAWLAGPPDRQPRPHDLRPYAGRVSGLSWFAPPIANVNSRLALTANAANGSLLVMGTAGATQVTEIFRLPVSD